MIRPLGAWGAPSAATHRLRCGSQHYSSVRRRKQANVKLAASSDIIEGFMLTADGCRERRARLFATLPVTPEWVLLSEPRHLMYFANFYASPFSFRTQNASALLILGADGSSTLVTDNMLGIFADRAHVDERVVADWYVGRGSAPERQSVLVDAGWRATQERNGARIGFDQMVPAELCLRLAKTRPRLQAAFVNATAAILMRRKDPDEIAVLRRAIGAMEAAFAAGAERIHAGMTELQAYGFVSDTSTIISGSRRSSTGISPQVRGPRRRAVRRRCAGSSPATCSFSTTRSCSTDIVPTSRTRGSWTASPRRASASWRVSVRRPCTRGRSC